MEKDIFIDNIKLHYDEVGPCDGVPVILMHGWGCNHTTVQSIVSILQSSMHVYNLDLPGHGQSQEPPCAWGVDEYTQFVEKFAHAAGIVNPVLIGHSFGGRIGLLMASRNRIRKMILVDAAGIKPHRNISYYYKVYSFKLLKNMLPLFIGKKRANVAIERYRNKAGSADYRQSSPVMKAVMSICVNQDLKHVMPSIKAPTLLIWGADDTATPLRDAKTMERLIPDAGLVSFEGCGHYSFLDNPFGFRAVVEQFFKNEMDHSEGVCI